MTDNPINLGNYMTADSHTAPRSTAITVSGAPSSMSTDHGAVIDRRSANRPCARKLDSIRNNGSTTSD